MGPQMATERIGVIGAGIVGLAVARRLTQLLPDAAVTVLDKEDRVAAHQTGHNSGVVHAGLYYAPGSLKATLCRRGVSLLREFCVEQDIKYVECGKVLVALDDVERNRLEDIAERAMRNGVPGVRKLNVNELREVEPNVAGIAGLHSPSTAIVDFVEVTRQLAADAAANGASIRTGSPVTSFRHSAREVVVRA